MDPLHNRSIVLGVSGSIACYKAVDLASRLVKAGALVDVVMTENATKFVTPLCFRSITHRPVVDDLWDRHSEMAIEHVGLAKRAAAILIAPATANLIAKLSLGFAEDALQTTVLDTRAPIVIAPAMEGDMYGAATTQEHIARLARARRHLRRAGSGATRLRPDRARAAGRSRDDPGNAARGPRARAAISPGGGSSSRRAARRSRSIRCGSSPIAPPARWAIALAEAARDRGAAVTLIATPTTDALALPFGVEVVRVGTVIEMHEAVRTATAKADALIMAAAVSDYRVAQPRRAEDQEARRGGQRPDDRAGRQPRYPGGDAGRLRARRLRRRERRPARQRRRRS